MCQHSLEQLRSRHHEPDAGAGARVKHAKTGEAESYGAEPPCAKVTLQTWRSPHNNLLQHHNRIRLQHVNAVSPEIDCLGKNTRDCVKHTWALLASSQANV